MFFADPKPLIGHATLGMGALGNRQYSLFPEVKG